MGSRRRGWVPRSCRQRCRPMRALRDCMPMADREGAVRAINLDVEAIPRRAQVELEAVRHRTRQHRSRGRHDHSLKPLFALAATGAQHSYPHPPACPVARRKCSPARFRCRDIGSRVECSRAFRQSHQSTWRRRLPRRATSILQIEFSLAYLLPDAQAGMSGQTLSSIPLSVANALEPLRNSPRT